MIRKTFRDLFKHYLFLLIFAAVLIYTGYGQPAGPERMVDDFNRYAQNHIEEKLFLHTDKETYLAGEIIWFKIFYVDASDHKPLSLSKVAYVELLDSMNNAVAQIKISLEEYKKHGSFMIPVSMPTGNYQLRAYTNWMKNSDPQFYFRKNLVVYNTLRPLPGINGSTSVKPVIAFFPEGGNLIHGISARIAFKVTDQYGSGLHFNGIIIKNNIDTIAYFRPFKFGMGSFLLVPDNKASYKAVITLHNGVQFEKSIPDISSEGISIAVREEEQAFYVSAHSSDIRHKQNVLLLAHTRQVTRLAEKGTIINGTAEFKLVKDQLGEGILHITLFDQEGEPVAERLVFIKPKKQLKIRATLPETRYSIRKKIEVDINTTPRSERKYRNEFVLSVARVDSISDSDENLLSYAWLSSDLTGYIESPGYYFSEDTSGLSQATDHLMLTHGWRRFRWKNLNTPPVQFPPEYNGHIIKAKLTQLNTGAPLINKPAYLSLPGKHFQLDHAKSDSNGIVQFELKDLYGISEIILQTDLTKDSLTRFEIQNPFSENHSTVIPDSRSMPPVHVSELLRRSIDMQVSLAYSGDSLSQFTVPAFSDTIPFYGTANYIYNLDDYTRFTTMEEVIREYIMPINVVMRRNALEMRMLNEPKRRMYDEDVFVMLNGVPIFNKNRIFNYDPLKIKKIEIIPQVYILGSTYFNGLASFITYQDDADYFGLDPRIIKVNYEGLQLQREFYSPVYEIDKQKSSPVPDFRSTLTWNPLLQTGEDGNAKIEFYSSDRPGLYKGILQGIDNEGNIGIASFQFRVVKENDR